MSDTSSSRWHERGQPDPHETRYDCARVDLAMGKLTDDELANGVYLWGDGTHGRPALQDVIDGKAHMPIAWLTAAKDRIRWLSRRIAKLQAAIRVNHEWHIDHDEHDGYPGSEMQAINLAALGDAALKTPTGWSATRRDDGGIDIVAPGQGPAPLALFQSGGSHAEDLLFALADAMLKEKGQ